MKRFFLFLVSISFIFVSCKNSVNPDDSKIIYFSSFSPEKATVSNYITCYGRNFDKDSIIKVCFDTVKAEIIKVHSDSIIIKVPFLKDSLTSIKIHYKDSILTSKEKFSFFNKFYNLTLFKKFSVQINNLHAQYFYKSTRWSPPPGGFETSTENIELFNLGTGMFGEFDTLVKNNGFSYLFGKKVSFSQPQMFIEFDLDNSNLIKNLNIMDATMGDYNRTTFTGFSLKSVLPTRINEKEIYILLTGKQVEEHKFNYYLNESASKGKESYEKHISQYAIQTDSTEIKIWIYK